MGGHSNQDPPYTQKPVYPTTGNFTERVWFLFTMLRNSSGKDTRVVLYIFRDMEFWTGWVHPPLLLPPPPRAWVVTPTMVSSFFLFFSLAVFFHVCLVQAKVCVRPMIWPRTYLQYHPWGSMCWQRPCRLPYEGFLFSFFGCVCWWWGLFGLDVCLCWGYFGPIIASQPAPSRKNAVKPDQDSTSVHELMSDSNS